MATGRPTHHRRALLLLAGLGLVAASVGIVVYAIGYGSNAITYRKSLAIDRTSDVMLGAGPNRIVWVYKPHTSAPYSSDFSSIVVAGDGGETVPVIPIQFGQLKPDAVEPSMFVEDMFRIDVPSDGTYSVQIEVAAGADPSLFASGAPYVEGLEQDPRGLRRSGAFTAMVGGAVFVTGMVAWVLMRRRD